MSVPAQYKPLEKTLAVAKQFEGKNDMVTVYWIRFHVLQQAMQIDSKSMECRKWLMTQMDWLESLKQREKENSAISTEIVGQSHMEQRALTVFAGADRTDREMKYGKNLVKAYFSAAIVMECLSVFGEISEDFAEKIKYSKWRATHIHTQLTKGEQPIPVIDEEESDPDDSFQPTEGISSGFSTQDQDLSHQPQDLSPQAQLDHYSSYEPPEIPETKSSTSTDFSPNAEAISRAQKLAKFAVSSLDYEDIPSAINNLERAINMLKFGKEQ